MSASIRPSTEKTAQVYFDAGFALLSQPVALQLTLHVQNYLLTYQEAGSIGVWKRLLEKPDLLDDESVALMPRQIIRHYGVKACQLWFTTVYGWNFTAKKSVNNKLVNKAG